MKWVGGDSRDTPTASGMLGNASHGPLQTVSRRLASFPSIASSLSVSVKVPEMARPVSSRSQDDAMVAYFFERPQTEGNFQAFGKHQSRWLGDESIVEVPKNITPRSCRPSPTQSRSSNSRTNVSTRCRPPPHNLHRPSAASRGVSSNR